MHPPHLPRLAFKVVLLWAVLHNQLCANSHLATGTALEADGQVRIPLYFYSDESVTAAQFDVPIPSGWTFSGVTSGPGLQLNHRVDGDRVSSGNLRFVTYSNTNTVLPNGMLGQIILNPPALPPPEIDIDFLQPVLVDTTAVVRDLDPGFPSLQIVSHPQSQTIASGQTADLSVSVVGIDPVFIWYQGSSGNTSTPAGTTAQQWTTQPLATTTSWWVRVSDIFGASLNSQTATITVEIDPTIVLNPTSRTVSASAGTGQIQVTAATGNNWNAQSNQQWLTFTNASGSGNGTIGYQFSANASLLPRSAQVTTGNATFTLNQQARAWPFDTSGSSRGWKNNSWLGDFNDQRAPWIHLLDFHWAYFHPIPAPGGHYIYLPESNLGWIHYSEDPIGSNGKWVWSYRYDNFVFIASHQQYDPLWVYIPSQGWVNPAVP